MWPYTLGALGRPGWGPGSRQRTNDSWVRFTRASGVEGACLGSGQGRTRPEAGVRVRPRKEGRALGGRHSLCRGPGAGRSRAPRQDWMGGDGAWAAAEASGEGLGAGSDPSGREWAAWRPWPPGSLQSVGCGAGLLWEERPLRLSAPPGAVRPSVLVQGSGCCT